MKIKQSTIMNRFDGGFGNPVNAARSVTGGNVNIYEPRTMQQPFVKRMPVTTWIRDTFFPSFTTFKTKHVDMDFWKNRQSVAPFVAQGSGPVNVRRTGFATKTYIAPFISLSRPYDTDLLGTRLPGEMLYSQLSPEDRAVMLMQMDYNELDDMITRREEVMTAELIQTGKVTITGYVDDKASEVRTDTVDFDFDNLISLTGTSQWSDPASDKYESLYEAVTLVRKAGYNPEYAVLGEGAARNLLADQDFMDHYMDKRYANFGVINPQLNIQNGNGYMYIGRLTELGIDLYQYLAYYYDEATQELKPYIAPDKVVVASSNVGEMLYGAITQIPEGSNDFVTIEAARVPKVTINRDADTKSLILKSRPIPKPFDVSSWAVIDTQV